MLLYFLFFLLQYLTLTKDGNTTRSMKLFLKYFFLALGQHYKITLNSGRAYKKVHLHFKDFSEVCLNSLKENKLFQRL